MSIAQEQFSHDELRPAVVIERGRATGGGRARSHHAVRFQSQTQPLRIGHARGPSSWVSVVLRPVTSAPTMTSRNGADLSSRLRYEAVQERRGHGQPNVGVAIVLIDHHAETPHGRIGRPAQMPAIVGQSPGVGRRVALFVSLQIREQRLGIDCLGRPGVEARLERHDRCRLDIAALLVRQMAGGQPSEQLARHLPPLVGQHRRSAGSAGRRFRRSACADRM